MDYDVFTHPRAPARRPRQIRYRSPRVPGTPMPGIRSDRLPVAGHGYDPERLVGRVELYLNNHLTDPNLDLTRLADAAYVSPSSLGRAFRDVHDTTPWRFVMRRRIDHAKTLLTDTDRSLTDIALDTGFYDQAHFSRTFKRFTGTTPSAFREAETTEPDLILEETEA